MFPMLNPPPSSLPILSLWVVPVHQPQASSIVHRIWILKVLSVIFYVWNVFMVCTSNFLFHFLFIHISITTSLPQKKKNRTRDFPSSPVVKTLLQLPETGIQSLVRVLRCYVAKKKTKTKKK